MQSLVSGQIHFDIGADLTLVLSDHLEGKVEATKADLPLALTYYEQYADEEEAQERLNELQSYGPEYESFVDKLAENV